MIPSVLRLLVLLTLVMIPTGTTLAAEQAAVSTPKAKASSSTVTFETNLGPIVIELFDDKAPVTTANFRQYVTEGYYKGLIFHRVIPGFVIQGGGFETGMKMRSPKHKPIPNEALNGLNNERGTLSMARTSDINSATSQFFINLNHNRSLDHTGNGPHQFGYAVFGKVVTGMDVVDKIAAIPTGRTSGFSDVPKEDAVILEAKITSSN